MPLARVFVTTDFGPVEFMTARCGLILDKKYRIEWATGLLTDGYIGMGLARNELMTPSVKRVGLRSPLFARRTIFLAPMSPWEPHGQ